MGESDSLSVQQDSGALWSQIQGIVDHSFKDVLFKLDEYQANEEISPYLAETIRDVFFQLSQENPARLNELRIKASSPDGPLLKYILTQLEDGGGDYRIRKSAELVGEKAHWESEKIRVEYILWQQKED